MDDRRRRVLDTCAAQLFAETTLPFGNDVAVFKIGGKIFAPAGLTGTPGEVSLKVDPELGATLVHQYGAVRPGYHLNKRHWVTVTMGGDLAEATLTELLEDAYDLVLSGLPRSVRLAFENVQD